MSCFDTISHTLSGCDTVFSFADIGKATVLKRLMTFTENLCLGDKQQPIMLLILPMLCCSAQILPTMLIIILSIYVL